MSFPLRIRSILVLLALVLPGALAAAPAAAQPCPDNCSGNGQCLGGRCLCQAGWSGLNCSVASCNPTCINGQCLNGGCACEPGWGGAACTEPRCPVDYNHNNTADVGDVFSFLSLWFENDFRADFNFSGLVNTTDIFAFLSAWFAGC